MQTLSPRAEINDLIAQGGAPFKIHNAKAVLDRQLLDGADKNFIRLEITEADLRKEVITGMMRDYTYPQPFKKYIDYQITIQNPLSEEGPKNE
ncbi:MAG: hypothetical protein P8P30_03665 [Rickettsiales bacterium]|nr:hypothetical protein [Rickettsiales bacterium]